MREEKETNNLLAGLEKASSSSAFAGLIQSFVGKIKHMIQYSISTGDDVIVDVVRKNKTTDVLASSEKYESLITRHSPQDQR
ncbi:hypothetical protein AX14_013771 [Amanita brunnescens Koide BX004]|nr:hypothetical protein AX14_013771 [Amanita brunnescens Koide BX004]